MSKKILISLIALFAAQAGVAHASGDSSCSASATFEHREYDACSDRAVISPGNDTRLNMMWLLADRGVMQPAAMALPEYAAYSPMPPAALLYWPTMTEARAKSASSANDDYATGRCVSNRGGQAAFAQAVAQASGLVEAERKALTDARAAMAQQCGNPEANHAPLQATLQQMQSREGKAFAAYLMAANVFYGDEPGASRKAFETLAGLSQPWVREASRYMLARVDLNDAQIASWTEYGTFERDKVNVAMAKRARVGFERYLAEYPRGAYADSARGLMRRVTWLEGDGTAMSLGYIAALSQPNASNMALLDELDNHVIVTNNKGGEKPLDTREPLLLAVDDLWRMRLDAKQSSVALSERELAAQQAAFAKEPELYRYLQAAHAYFVRGDAAAVLRILPEATPKKGLGYVAFSSQMLRLQAMQLAGKPGVREGLLQLWQAADRPHQRPMVEMMLAIHDEYAGKPERVFAADSRVQDPAIRRTLLQSVAGPELLQQQVTQKGVAQNERDIALFTLLYRNLTRGRFDEFVKWQEKLPTRDDKVKDQFALLYPRPTLSVFRWAGESKGYACPALTQVAGTLARNAADPRANLCLGEFLRINGFDHFELADPSSPYETKWRKELRDARTLGASPLRFSGDEINRQSIYQRVMKDAAASNDDRAYALYRAVQCYAPSGMNDCGGAEVPKAERKRWFTELKTRYKDSRWAAATKLYW